jgi:hypothetical protein
MQLTPAGQQKVNDIAQQYEVSNEAVMTLLQALLNGNGTMAQFNHPELGGGGQWMQGGMTMIGDMFNNRLKAIVEGICFDLSNLLANQTIISTLSPHQSQNLSGQQQQQGLYAGDNLGGNNEVSLFVPQANSSNWWPSELGMASATGAQNNIRYAYFSDSRRLALDLNGQISIYDTLDHQIGGVSQQQGGGASLTFTSQYGTVEVSSLPLVSGSHTVTNEVFPTQTDTNPPSATNQEGTTPPPLQTVVQEQDIFATIERLAELKQKGILTEEEFVAKKNELLSRL